MIKCSDCSVPSSSNVQGFKRMPASKHTQIRGCLNLQTFKNLHAFSLSFSSFLPCMFKAKRAPAKNVGLHNCFIFKSSCLYIELEPNIP